MSCADGEEVGVEVKRVSEEKLAKVPGNKLTGFRVNYAPGGKSGAHRHAGSVFSYVLSGSIRSENSATSPARVYKTGKLFQAVRKSAPRERKCERKEPASRLAVFAADDGARLTTFD